MSTASSNNSIIHQQTNEQESASNISFDRSNTAENKIECINNSNSINNNTKNRMSAVSTSSTGTASPAFPMPATPATHGLSQPAAHPPAPAGDQAEQSESAQPHNGNITAIINAITPSSSSNNYAANSHSTDHEVSPYSQSASYSYSLSASHHDHDQHSLSTLSPILPTPLPIKQDTSMTFSNTKTMEISPQKPAPQTADTHTAAHSHSHNNSNSNNGNPPPLPLPQTSSAAKIHAPNQPLFSSLYAPNVSGLVTPVHRSSSFNSASFSNNANKTWPENKGAVLRRGRPKKPSHSHRKAFEAGHPRFERALQQLIEMRQRHPQGLLPSIRGFMQTIHMGFANTNAVVKYYAENYLNMTLDDFKRDYMVIRRVRAKTRNVSGGRPKKDANKLKQAKLEERSSNESDSDDDDSMPNGNRFKFNHVSNTLPIKQNDTLAITQQSPQFVHQQQQLFLNSLQQAHMKNVNTSTDTINANDLNLNGFHLSNIPAFHFSGLQNQNFSIHDASQQEMPKLIADSKLNNTDMMDDEDEEDDEEDEEEDIDLETKVKLEAEHKLQLQQNPQQLQRLMNFTPMEFIGALERDLATLMRVQNSNNNQVAGGGDSGNGDDPNAVSPEDIKKPLQVVRKRLLTMLDRKLYHQLTHTQKVTIAKANLIAGICTAAIHTGYCKDALALYRQALTLFRELNEAAVNDGSYTRNENPEEHKKEIDPFILKMIENTKCNEQDPGKYSMFIVVIYYQMSLLYDKSLIEKVQKSHYYLIQALNLLVRENAMNSNKYCIETLQRLALFALETGKDNEYISLMCITLNILKKHNESNLKILDVEIHFVKNLLGYGKQLGEQPSLMTNPSAIQRFAAVKTEYQKLLTVVIDDAKNNHGVLSNETRPTLSRLLALAKYLLEAEQLNESYKIYHCMRQICDNTQINLDLEFMKVWIDFVKQFIQAIVSSSANIENVQTLWQQQLLELCEFDVKVLEKIKQSADSTQSNSSIQSQIGADLYQQYMQCAQALMKINNTNDKLVVARCQQYLQKATTANDAQIKNDAMQILSTLN